MNPFFAEGIQGRRMKSSSQKREHIIIVPGGLLAAKFTNGFSTHQAIAGSLTGQKIFDA